MTPRQIIAADVSSMMTGRNTRINKTEGVEEVDVTEVSRSNYLRQKAEDEIAVLDEERHALSSDPAAE